MSVASDAGIAIDEAEIRQTLARIDKDPARVRGVLAKARALTGLDAGEVASLTAVSDPELVDEMFAAARFVKEEIYGRRLVLFAPLYISNLCTNECLYCAFRASNAGVRRKALTTDQIARETTALTGQGHKRVLLVVGESYPEEGLRYVFRAIETIYATKNGPGEIRRVNVNAAPMTVEEFRDLKAVGIGTYQVFQETYDRETYAHVHPRGKKRDYEWRISAMDRAMEAGIDDVGIGVLFGLADWRYELLALMQHIRHLEDRFGVGPHTISVPRLEPATGSELSVHPPHPVSDDEFRKIVAILRLAVPYTGIIMSTREVPALRRETFALGVSQISAGSRTNPGGYSVDEQDASQFSLGDHRPLDEVIRDVASHGYIPSFCTACYRLGRTGRDFMDLAKPGEIKSHCSLNALSTFTEYLEDYASSRTKEVGESAIAAILASMERGARGAAERMITKVRKGQRDVFC